MAGLKELLPQPTDVLSQAIAELKKNPFLPEAVTKYWRAKLQADGKRKGIAISVSDCNWAEEEIRKPMVGVRGEEVSPMMVYVPEELMGKEGLEKLRKMYPAMSGWTIRKATAYAVQDDPDANKRGGWIKVEATVNAPNLDTTQKDLEMHAEDKKYSPQRLVVYVLASQASKDLMGCYFDEKRTSSRLGSLYGEFTVYAYFGSGGFWDVCRVVNPQGRSLDVGGRFEQAKKA